MELLPGVLAAASVYLFRAHPQGAPTALLTATSILTGFTFAMAMQMWKQSLDARRDTRYAFDPDALELLDLMRTRLVWTVWVGVLSSTWLAGVWMFTVSQPDRWALAVSAFLFIYQVVLVGTALWRFHAAAITLR